ncbi:MAG: hypothetical protein M1836_001872 [Candelina mexicana]|nr:MAG: hypothetical protein M1836_001872 [Candelina mexicana]
MKDFSYLPTNQGKRLFIKDITHYLVPPNGQPASIAPSLLPLKKGVGTLESQQNTNGEANGVAHCTPYPYPTPAEPGNPTVIPKAVLEEFHFTFLIRHPSSSIPSYYRCTVPPLDEVTGFYNFMPSEVGYSELRRVFDYLRSIGQVGPTVAGRDAAYSNGTNGVNGEASHAKVDICVVDADDLLDNPGGMIEAYCKSVGIDYDERMLNWDTPEEHEQAKNAFAKWNGFHNDAIESSCLKPRLHVSRPLESLDLAFNFRCKFFLFRFHHQPPLPSPSSRLDILRVSKRTLIRVLKPLLTYFGYKKKQMKSNEDQDSEWNEKFGAKGAKIIRETVNANIADYEYLKSFAIKV